MKILIPNEEANTLRCCQDLAPGIPEIHHGVVLLRTKHAKCTVATGSVEDLVALFPDAIIMPILRREGIHYVRTDSQLTQDEREADEARRLLTKWRSEESGHRYDLLEGK